MAAKCREEVSPKKHGGATSLLCEGGRLGSWLHWARNPLCSFGSRPKDSQMPGSGTEQRVSAQTLAQKEKGNLVKRGEYYGERGESSSRRSRARSEDTGGSAEARNDRSGREWPEPFLEASAQAVNSRLLVVVARLLLGLQL